MDLVSAGELLMAVVLLGLWAAGLVYRLDVLGATDRVRWAGWLLALAGPGIALATYVTRAPLPIALLSIAPVLMLTVVVVRLPSIPGSMSPRAKLLGEWLSLVQLRAEYPERQLDLAELRQRLEDLDYLRSPDTDEFITLGQDEFAEWLDGGVRDNAVFEQRSARLKALATTLWGDQGVVRIADAMLGPNSRAGSH